MLILCRDLIALLLAHDEVEVLVIEALILSSRSCRSIAVLVIVPPHRQVRLLDVLASTPILYNFGHCYRRGCCSTDNTPDRIPMPQCLLGKPDGIERCSVVELRQVLQAIIRAVHFGSIGGVALAVTLFALLQEDGSRGHVLNLDLIPSLARLQHSST